MTPPPVSSRGRMLALIAALLGWMFDGMEMGLFPLVGKDALRELLGTGASPEAVDRWYGVTLACFLVGAATGGVLFGWLGDKIGRVRAMTVSILLYSLCSGLSAASQTPEQLAFLRFLGALGMGGEWALGVALVMELWPGASRAMMAGLIGAFGNFGYLICGGIAYGLNHTGPGQLQEWLTGVGFPTDWASALTANRNWRLLMLVGAIPALLTMLIRLFVPESEKWERAKEAGKASHWSERDLIGVLIGAAAAGGVIVLWAVRDLHLSIRILGSAIGLVVVVLGYLYPALCILSLVSMVAFYRLNTEYGLIFVLSAGWLGLISASFYGWLPLYLPELFPTAVRATGQGFGFNFGRIIAAAGNLQMANLLAAFGNDYSQACALVAGVYLIGLVLIGIAPETKGKPLPE